MDYGRNHGLPYYYLVPCTLPIYIWTAKKIITKNDVLKLKERFCAREFTLLFLFGADYSCESGKCLCTLQIYITCLSVYCWVMNAVVLGCSFCTVSNTSAGSRSKSLSNCSAILLLASLPVVCKGSRNMLCYVNRTSVHDSQYAGNCCS